MYGENESRYISLTPTDEPLLDEFCDILRYGKMAQTYDDLVSPVVLMDAIYLSYFTGTEQRVKPVR